jgi:uncharacterized protein
MAEHKKRGFATMNPEKQRAIAQQGGRAAHKKGVAHEFSREEAQKAGERGGLVVSQNRAHMAEIGRKGARSAQRGSSSTIDAPVPTPETRDLVKPATVNRTDREHGDEVERDLVELQSDLK